jgi:prefoldin beta subunit
MEVSKETQNKINQISMFEENLRALSMKKQAMHSEQIEIKNATQEVGKAEGNMYKIVGPVMIRSDKEAITKELTSKQEMVELRLQSITKQETQINEKAKALQEELMKEMEQNETRGNK